MGVAVGFTNPQAPPTWQPAKPWSVVNGAGSGLSDGGAGRTSYNGTNPTVATGPGSGLTDSSGYAGGRPSYNGTVPVNPNTGGPVSLSDWAYGGSKPASGSSSSFGGVGSGFGAPTGWTPYSPQGAGENYWQQTGNQWQQPGAASQYWNGNQGFFNGGPTSSERAIQGYGNQLGGSTGALENLYGQYAGNGTFTNPGQSEQWYSQNGQAMNRAGQGENTIGSLLPQYGNAGDVEKYYANNGQFFGQSGAAENYYNQNRGFFGASGASENLNSQLSPRLTGQSFLDQNQVGILGDIGKAGNMQSAYDQSKGDLGQAGYAERLANQGLPQSSYSEDFLTGGAAGNGLDALYSRLYGQGAKHLDEAAAARGGFNSGAALRAQEELGADMNAQHVRDYQAAATQADQARMQRLGYGLDLSNSADTSLRGRIGLGYQGAQGADQSALAQAGARQSLYQNMGAEQRANFGLAGDLANNAQSQALSRMMGGGTLANNAQSQALARMTEGGNLANASQAAMLGRMNGQVSAANTMDSLAQNRFSLGSNAATAAQNAANQRITTGINAANMSQTANTNRLKTAAELQSQSQNDALARMLGGGQLATSAGNEAVQRLTGGQNAANSAQTDQQNRENSVFDNLLRQGQTQGQAYSNQMSQARQEQMQAAYQEINGILAKGQNASAAEQQRMQMLMQMVQMPFAAGSAVGGMPGGGRSAPLNTNIGGTGNPSDFTNFLG